MRKYPIGFQDFRKIREEGFLYVDKTRLTHSLIESGSYYFLSRPRRFGKSLLLSTVGEIFSGSKELFKGLWIEDQWNWEKKHPVIRISFSDIGVATMGLANAIFNGLKQNALYLGVTLQETTIDQQFAELIRKASVKGKVVILIDEYDKPIVDNLDNIALAEDNRTIMKNFYSIIKGSDSYIRFLLITGVSRFAKVSIFSDLNNLEDISISETMNDLTGITQIEVETNFEEEIEALALKEGVTQPRILEEIKRWYNGYSWGGANTIYNPFSLLSLMKQRQFKNFWFATGSPSFLIKQIRQKSEYKFEDIRLSENALGNFDITNMSSGPLLFQTGYLTIKEYDRATRTYRLDYPNQEVRDSLLDNLLSVYREVFPEDSAAITGDLLGALRKNDIPAIIEGLNGIISTIPYDHWKADAESIFHIITHLTFKKIGVDIESEVHSAKGRCDVLIKTGTSIYAIELKLNATAQKALDQIVKKEYLTPYQSDPRKKIALGINFSSEKRTVTDYLVKEI